MGLVGDEADEGEEMHAQTGKKVNGHHRPNVPASAISLAAPVAAGEVRS